MANDNKRGGGTGGKAEDGPLKGGEPIDPARQDHAPHPTKEAEKRCDEVQAGKRSDGTNETRGDGGGDKD